MLTAMLQAFLGLLLAAVIPAAQAEGKSELDRFREAIRARYDLKEKAFAENKPDLVVDQFYSEDVISVDHEGKVHQGREALRAIYREAVPGNTVRVSSIHCHVQGNTGWDWANFHVTPKDPAQQPFSFIILFLWEKRDGKWWCVGDMYTLGEMASPG